MSKKKILIVDDEKQFTHLVKLNLEATEKYDVRVENNGLNGLAAVKEFKPDLILLDILMPDIAGSEVAYQLKNEKETKNIPVVFLTAIATKAEVHRQGNIIGGHPFVAKPVSEEELIDVIEKNLLK